MGAFQEFLRRRTWPARFAALCLATLFLSGCHDEEQELPYVDLTRQEPAPGVAAPSPSGSLRVAGAPMISPLEGYAYYRQMLSYLSERIGRPITLVQRKTYHEINELLKSGGVDAAFVCSGAYVKDAEGSGIQVLVVPVVQGRTTYKSYLVVRSDSPFRSLGDLEGARFAFTDPLSFSGRYYVLYRLQQIGRKPETFFSRIVYSGGHDASVRAVARAEADGAAVDSLVFEYMRSRGSPEAARVRILEVSEPFGIPPFVVSRNVADDVRSALEAALLGMGQDSEGKEILAQLGLDGFERPPEGLYESIREILRVLGER